MENTWTPKEEGYTTHASCRERDMHTIMGVVCDKYCKYPELCADEKALDRHCDKCKVAELLGVQ